MTVQAPPTFAQIEPVGSCNLRCRMCPVRYRAAGNALMKWDLFVTILDQLPAVRELHLQGLGEPLLHPRFFDMAAYATARGITVTVNTNLSVLSVAMARRLVSCGIATVYVSVDAVDPSTYEWLRDGARFDRLERNLDHLLAAASASARPRIELVAVAMRATLERLPDLVRFAADRGIPAVHVQHLCHDYAETALPVRYAPMRVFVDEQTLIGYDRAAVRQAFDAASGAAARHGVRLRLPPTECTEHAPSTPGRERCDWPWRGPYITYDGTVMPCCIAATPERAAIGSVEGSAIATLWNGPAYTAFRRALSSATPPEICRSCSIYRHVF